jgi:AcrR family transcriptional regulator
MLVQTRKHIWNVDMGQKRELLAGAKKCLREKGYAKTTARDIVGASGANLASIGYHYGSKDGLMTQAIIEMLGEFGEQFDPAQDTTALPFNERFAAYWNGLSEALGRDSPLAMVGFENAAVAARMPELKQIIADGQECARMKIGADYTDDSAAPRTQRAVGSVMLGVTTGMIAQFLMDPSRSPSAEEIVEAFRYIGDALSSR